VAIPSPYAVLPPASASRPESEKARAHVESLEHEARQAVEEARMVLPGIQALFGFQLIAVFNQRYTELPVRQSPSRHMLRHPALARKVRKSANRRPRAYLAIPDSVH
jgi:hypothetical protein